MSDISGLFLSQAGTTFRLILYLCLVMLAVLVLGFGLKYLRRRFHTSPPERPTGPGFTMDDLERLRDAGELTDAEFKRLRSRVLEVAALAPDKEQSAGEDSSLRPPAGDDDELEAEADGDARPDEDEKDV